MSDSTTCKTCGRAVYEADVDASGNCVFCDGSQPREEQASQDVPGTASDAAGASQQAGAASEPETPAPAASEADSGSGKSSSSVAADNKAKAAGQK